MTNLRKFGLVCMIVGSCFLFSGSFFEYIEEEKFQEFETIRTSKEEYASLFKDKKQMTPKENITIPSIVKIKLSANNIKTKKERDFLLTKLSKLTDFVQLNNDINKIFPNKILNSSTNETIINQIKNKYNSLDKKYQVLLENEIKTIEEQYNNLVNVQTMIATLYKDKQKTTVSETVTRDQYQNCVTKLQSLPQLDVVYSMKPYLNNALNKIEEKEKKAEEDRRRQEEEQRRRIEQAYVILNTPYISQTANGVLNGCEVASLLMALQYRGYLTNTSLYKIATDVPKHESDAYQGFVSSIFDLEPRDRPHWIAPSALAKFGRDYSGYGNIFDITSSTPEQLKNELNQGNPVIVYITGFFKQPKNWYYEVPNNFHVALLIGYNKITGSYVLHDPWTTNNGNGRTIIDKNTFESIYNQIGKKAVVIR